MTLRPEPDLQVADWFATAEPRALTTLGPPGFAAYARVLHAVDSDGDRVEGHLQPDQLDALCDVLARYSLRGETHHFGLWEGWGDIHGGDAMQFLTLASRSPWNFGPRMFTREKPPSPVPPAFAPEVMAGPLLRVAGEDHFLFTGALAEAGRWGARPLPGGSPRDINSPTFMWPHSRSWFVATGIDSPWTGIGGSERLIADLLATPGLEVVRTRHDGGAPR